MSRRPSTMFGAELDGTTLRLVRVEGSRVTAYEQVTITGQNSAARIMRHHLGRRGTGVLAWASPGIALRRSPLPSVPDRQVASAVRDVLDRHLPGGGALPGAGLVRPLQDSARSLATIGVITADAGLALRDGLGNTACSLVVAPFTLSHDGLYLALRSSCAELTLVQDGIAHVTRQLRCGGLIAGTQNDTLGLSLPPRSLELVAAGDTTDPTLLLAARRYVASLAREIHRTIEHWEWSGETCPRSLWVYGAGATLPHLPSFITSVGLTARQAPVSEELDLSVIPPDERLAAYGAIAAATAPIDEQPLIDLTRATRGRLGSGGSRTSGPSDPFAGFEGVMSGNGTRGFSSPVLGRSSDNSLPQGLGTVLIACAITAVFGLGAWWNATRALDNANSELTAAARSVQVGQARNDYASAVAQAASEVRRLSPKGSPGWNSALSTLMTYLPADPKVASIRMATNGEALEATVAAPLPMTAETIAAWRTALENIGTVAEPTVQSTPNGDTEVFVVTFPPPAISTVATGADAAGTGTVNP